MLIGDSSLATPRPPPPQQPQQHLGAEATGSSTEEEEDEDAHAPIVYGRCNFIFACDDDNSNENDDAAAAVAEVESAARQGRTPNVTPAQRARLICEVVEIMPPL
jgi:hypothetical protein